MLWSKAISSLVIFGSILRNFWCGYYLLYYFSPELHWATTTSTSHVPSTSPFSSSYRQKPCLPGWLWAARWYLATKRNRFYGHCWCWWRFFNVQFTLLTGIKNHGFIYIETIGPFDNRLSTTMFLCSQNYTDNTINIRTINVYTDAHKYLTSPNNLQNIYIIWYDRLHYRWETLPQCQCPSHSFWKEQG